MSGTPPPEPRPGGDMTFSYPNNSTLSDLAEQILLALRNQQTWEERKAAIKSVLLNAEEIRVKVTSDRQ